MNAAGSKRWSAWLLLVGLAFRLPGWAAPPVVLEPGARAALEELARLRPGVRPGEWVTYALEREGQHSFVRFAVVGEERDAQGREAYWLEVELGDHPALKAPLAQFRMLVARALGVQGGVSRLFVALGYGKPQEVPAEQLLEVMGEVPRAVGTGAPDSADAALPQGMRLETRAPQRVLTAAGSVRATPVDLIYRQTTVRRMWLSPEVPVLRLARLEIPGLAQRMEVQAFGLDAKPRMLLPEPKKRTISPTP